jgi:hypothetical protein
LYRRRLGGKRHRETCQRAAGGTAGEPPALRASPLARAFSEARSAKRRPLIRLRHLLPRQKDAGGEGLSMDERARTVKEIFAARAESMG